MRGRLAWLVLAALAGCGGGGASAGAGGHEVPTADLRGVDPDIVRAVEEARAQVARHPDSSHAWGGLGDRFLVHLFLSEAARCYERAYALDPTAYRWAYRMGWALITEDPERARQAFEQALPSLGDYAPGHDAYAQALFRLGRTEEAARHFARASEIDPGFAPSWAGRGQVALALGEYEQARGHLEEALRLDPGFTEAHLALAQVLTALGVEEEARRHAELSRSLPQVSQRTDPLATPDLPPAGARDRTVYARALEKARSFDEAIENYRIAIASNPHYYVARKRLARLLDRRGRTQEALDLLEEGLELTPGSQEIRDDIERLRQ